MIIRDLTNTEKNSNAIHRLIEVSSDTKDGFKFYLSQQKEKDVWVLRSRLLNARQKINETSFEKALPIAIALLKNDCRVIKDSIQNKMELIEKQGFVFTDVTNEDTYKDSCDFAYKMDNKESKISCILSKEKNKSTWTLTCLTQRFKTNIGANNFELAKTLAISVIKWDLKSRIQELNNIVDFVKSEISGRENMNDINFQEQKRQALEFVGNSVYAINEHDEIVPISITSMVVDEAKQEIILKFYENEICYFSDLDKEEYSIYSTMEKASEMAKYEASMDK